MDQHDPAYSQWIEYARDLKVLVSARNSSVKTLSRRIRFNCVTVLFGFVVIAATSAAHAESHQVFAKLNGVQAGYRIIAGRDSSAIISYLFYETRPNTVQTGASFQVKLSDLENNVPIEGTKTISLPLPGCNFYNSKAAKYTFRDGVLELSMTVRPEELWNDDCKKGQNAAGPEIKLTFPALTREDRARFNLAPSPAEAKTCNLLVGSDNSINDIVGKELTVYPNGWAHVADAFATASQPFADMTIGTIGQIGPNSWAPQKSFVFRLGDVLTVKRMVLTPKPGAQPGDRPYLAEVMRRSDGLSGVIDLNQLISGSPIGCYPSKYIGTTRRIDGVFVKVKPGAKLLTDTNNRQWVNDPSIRYGYCQDFREGYFSCQTRAGDKSKLFAVSSWLATPEEVDVMIEFPPEKKDIQFRS